MPMLSMSVPLGGSLALIGVILLAGFAKGRRSRVGYTILAIAGLAVAQYGYLRISREDRIDREALLKERKHVCGSVAFHILGAQGDYLGTPYRPPVAVQNAGLRSLGWEVLVTWNLCVRKESECASMQPGLPLDVTEDVLRKVQKCFQDGPTPLESARRVLEN